MNFEVLLSGHRAHRADIGMPARGLWSARLELDEEVSFAIGAIVVVSIGDVALSGAIVRGNTFAGTARYLVRAGRGGWQKKIPKKGYRSDGGVKASTVLQDAALAAGELWGAPLPTTALGPAYARREAPAVHVVTALLGAAWYIDDAGATQPVDRPASTFKGEVLDFGADDRWVDLATDTPSTIRPGCTVPGIGVTTFVRVKTDALKIRIEARGAV